MNSPYPYGPGGPGQGGYDPAYGYGPGGYDPAYQQGGAYPQPGYAPGAFGPPPQFYGPPPPYYGAPQRKSRAWIWVLIAAVVVVVVAAVGTTVAVMLKRKPDFTALSSAMTLPKSEFPSLPDGEFSVEPVDRNPDYERVHVTPTECEYLVGYPKAQETVSARVSSDSSIVAVYLQLDSVRPDLKTALDECSGKTLRGDDSTYEVRALKLSGVPSWAISETLNYDNQDSTGGNTVIGGYYRGIYVEAWSSSDDTDFDTNDLVNLFNAQVDRLDERS